MAICLPWRPVPCSDAGWLTATSRAAPGDFSTRPVSIAAGAQLIGVQADGRCFTFPAGSTCSPHPQIACGMPQQMQSLWLPPSMLALTHLRSLVLFAWALPNYPSLHWITDQPGSGLNKKDAKRPGMGCTFCRAPGVRPELRAAWPRTS